MQGAGEGLVASQSFRLYISLQAKMIVHYPCRKKKMQCLQIYHYIATAQSYTWFECEVLPEQLYVPH